MNDRSAKVTTNNDYTYFVNYYKDRVEYTYPISEDIVFSDLEEAKKAATAWCNPALPVEYKVVYECRSD